MQDTKTKHVLNHLITYGHITSWEAIELYRATRLSAIIFALRAAGLSIRTDMIMGEDINGDSMRYGKYVLEDNIPYLYTEGSIREFIQGSRKRRRRRR